MADPVTEFLAKNQNAASQKPVLDQFVDFLKESGQLIPGGDLKAQFTEKRIVQDKNKKKIEVTSCLVCSSEEMEVIDD